ncbi:hypothetical protein [Methanobrevibacter sp.]|uniref:hypothetical protein n=1 Tax=Methanobrevibacter sp. TaxID=66852 RepID=UPI003890618A
MNNPEDTFMKRQFTYLGDIAHEFYNLPGEYIGSECNEYPNVDGGIPRADIVYEVRMEDGSICIINIEDETSYVNADTLKKSYNYKTNIYYKTKNPVISVITTTLPEDKCLKELWISPTDLFKPFVISLHDENTWKKLNSMITKAKNQEEFSEIEGLELINLPRFCCENQEKAIEVICSVLYDLKIEDPYVKNELIYSMQCMIHKYAKTDEDIIRLEGMIRLRQVMKKRSPVLDAMERQGVLKGRKQGIKQGREEGIKKGREEGIKEGREEGMKKVLKDLANNGTPIDELAEKYGYTVDEILNTIIE